MNIAQLYRRYSYRLCSRQSSRSTSPELIRKAPAIINPKGYIAGVAKCCGQIVFILDPDALREDFKVE